MEDRDGNVCRWRSMSRLRARPSVSCGPLRSEIESPRHGVTWRPAELLAPARKMTDDTSRTCCTARRLIDAIQHDCQRHVPFDVRRRATFSHHRGRRAVTSRRLLHDPG